MATTLLFPKTAGRGGEEAVAAFLKLLLHSCSSRSGFRRKPWAGCLKTPPGSPAMVRVQQWVGAGAVLHHHPHPWPQQSFWLRGKERTFAFKWENGVSFPDKQLRVREEGMTGRGRWVKWKLKKKKKKVKLICLAFLESYSQRISAKLSLFSLSFLMTKKYGSWFHSTLPKFPSSNSSQLPQGTKSDYT